jgi:hypothetical protein
MNDRTEQPAEARIDRPTAPTDPTAATGPTRAQRLGLARGVAARALARPDPLQASLGVVLADVLGLTHALGSELQTALAGPAGGHREQLARDAGDYLRLTRELGRLARLERQVATTPPGAAGEKPSG